MRIGANKLVELIQRLPDPERYHGQTFQVCLLNEEMNLRVSTSNDPYPPEATAKIETLHFYKAMGRDGKYIWELNLKL